MSKGIYEEGRMELQQYLRDIPIDVMHETDIIEWWLVCVCDSSDSITALTCDYRLMQSCTLL
jgi:hypothetical protein